MGNYLENHAKIIHNQKTEGGGIKPGTPLPFLRFGGGEGGGVGGLRPDKSGVRI